jgi:hypothetical protein
MSETLTTVDPIIEEETLEETAAPAEVTDGADSLGDAGKRALDSMKAERNASRLEAKEARAEIARMNEAKESAGKPAEEQALDAARREATLEATTKANERILRSELRAAAKGKLADPTDAQLYIDLSEFEVGEDGEIDSDALDDAIDALLARKPHLTAGTPRRFEGDGDQGAGGKTARVVQLTESDISTMSPEAINKARKSGQLDKLLGIKN